jgi:renalase
MSRVAVVGAGIAGLAAARALHDRGHEVVVFERSPVVGGRVGTRMAANIELPSRGSVDLAFDHGAQYFTVRDPRFSEVVAYWQRDRIVANWNARIVTFDGEGWEEVAKGTARYVGVPGMQAIAARMAEGLDVQLGSRINSIASLAGFDRIILAVPAAQALPLLTNTPLHEKVAAVSMKPCWCVMAAFDERVRTRFDAAFISGSPLGWVSRNSSKPASPKRSDGGDIDAWVLHASAEWSSAHMDDPSDAVGPFLLGAFSDLVPAGLPKVFHVATHRWRYATADPGLAVGAMHDPAGRISVCGDWCSGPRVENAYLSGLDAARTF